MLTVIYALLFYVATTVLVVGLAWLDADVAQIGAQLLAQGPRGSVTVEVARDAVPKWT